MAEVDIFNPQVSKVAKGLEGKVILIYGTNNVGKTANAVKMNKPYIMACESGLNAQSGVNYNKINNWSEFRKVVKQFTSKATIEKAKELYSTIVIDEVYASSIFCQDYVISTYGDGALTMAGNPEKGKASVNLYQIYEKEYFRQINLLVGAGYTVVFIAHEEEKDGFIVPKGDKRCINPIVNNCDYVVYVKPNGMDENNRVIKSSAYLAATDEFFARSRFEETPTVLPEFTVEALENAIKQGIEAHEKKTGTEAVSYEQQKELNTSKAVDFEDLMQQVQSLGEKFIKADKQDVLIEIVENTLGAGGKVSGLTKKQVEALTIIFDELSDMAKELKLE